MKSYSILKPMDPNYLLSYITAWKKHKEYNNLWNWIDSELKLIDCIWTEVYDPNRLDLIPLGGSLVILMDVYTTEVGRSGDG